LSRKYLGEDHVVTSKIIAYKNKFSIDGIPSDRDIFPFYLDQDKLMLWKVIANQGNYRDS